MKHTLLLSLLFITLSTFKTIAQTKPFPNPEDSAKIAQAMSFLQAQDRNLQICGCI
ncbi:hypothetical protein [Dyadobacter arcticus]|uniref:Uncharacterized protein n=1 Tax=Dyadobacter arcticus TaxID=1078754 RepID=A0ABX0USB6_9BACT|nr:hypothetical protein [Dyadobacter arcticus]NIJ55861.1 hypothetical protein [Dyadobacter arcticus]